jgi:hypothetical protein
MASSAFHPPGWRWSPWPLVQQIRCAPSRRRRCDSAPLAKHADYRALPSNLDRTTRWRPTSFGHSRMLRRRSPTGSPLRASTSTSVGRGDRGLAAPGRTRRLAFYFSRTGAFDSGPDRPESPGAALLRFCRCAVGLVPINRQRFPLRAIGIQPQSRDAAIATLAGLMDIGCGLRIMSIRWCHVAQTIQERHFSRRDAKAQRRRLIREGEDKRTGNIEHCSYFLCASASLRGPFLAERKGFGHHFEAAPIATVGGAMAAQERSVSTLGIGRGCRCPIRVSRCP